jgi:cellulose synthase/poly-beta-1,6-N-acetylglucosamine synthase-like glycosyltransferase
MELAGQILFWIAAAEAVMYAVAVGQFSFLLRRSNSLPSVEHAWPKTAILLPLRGADPHLAETIRKLLRQDYPDYELRVIVDSATDPALTVVESVVAETTAENVQTTIIRHKRPTCSPQCSALIEGVESLGPEVEVVAVLDGDVQTHPSWLRELVNPLLESGVGAAHGNRWFLPREAGWGSLVRYLWIAASIIPMYWFGIPWAGTFAVRRRFLHDSGLLTKWSKTIVPDAPTIDYLKQAGLQVRFVPSLMMVNREKCGLAFAHDFIKRQLTWTRLYHGQFGPVLFHALMLAAQWILAIGLTIAGLVLHQPATAAWAGGALLLMLLTQLASLGALEAAVRHVVRRRETPDMAVPWQFLWRLPAAILLAIGVHASGVLLATFRNRVAWRGVTYVVRDPFDVYIETDEPPVESGEPIEANVSL